MESENDKQIGNVILHNFRSYENDIPNYFKPPDQKTCICIGYLPVKYSYENDFAEIKAVIKDQILEMISLGVRTFYSDMRQGVGIWSVQILAELKQSFPDLQIISLLAYPGQEERSKKIEGFNEILSLCDANLYTEKQKSNFSIHNHQHYIAQKIDIIIAFYDKDGDNNSRTALIAKNAKQYGKEVICISPFFNGASSSYNQNFAKNLAKLRIQEGISRSYLARFMGYKPSIIAKFEDESRYPTCNDLVKIAVYFGVSVDELLGAPNLTTAEGPLWYRTKFLGLDEEIRKTLIKLIDRLYDRTEQADSSQTN